MAHYYPASRTSWLCSNLLEEDGEPLAGASRDAIVDWSCGQGGGAVRVGLFAVGYDWRGPENKHKLRYLDAVEEAKVRVQSLQAQGAQVVVALTHLPLSSTDDDGLCDESLLRGCPGIDLVLGGHDHFYYYSGNLVKSGSDFRHLSHITVRLEHGQVASIECERFDVTRGVPANAEMAALVDKYDRLMEVSFGRRVGRTAVELDSREQTLRFGESRLMNFVCDAAVELAVGSRSSASGAVQVHACLLEGYNVAGEQVTPAGDITMKELSLWFASKGEMLKLVVIRLTVGELREHLERGIAPLPDESWGLLHVSGSLNYVADLSRPGGSRLTQLLLCGSPVDPCKELNCVVSAQFAKYWATVAQVVVDEEGTRSLLEIVLRRLAEVPEVTADMAPLGRITLQGVGAAAEGLGLPKAGLPDVSSDLEASRERYRSVDTLLGLEREAWLSRPVVVATNNFSKLLRMVEVFGAHRVPVEHSHRAIPLHRRRSLVSDGGADGLTRFQRDCVWKMLAYAPGTLVIVAGLCIEPRPSELRGDQWFFADITPGGTEVYVKDRIGLVGSGRKYRFRPSRPLRSFLGRPGSFSVLLGRAVPPPEGAEAGELRCEFFDGGSIFGQIVAPRGVQSPAPCLPFEYMFQPHGSGGRTLAEARAEEWEALAAQGRPRLIDQGPYAAAARRFVSGVPSSVRTVQIAEPRPEPAEW